MRTERASLQNSPLSGIKEEIFGMSPANWNLAGVERRRKLHVS